MASGMTTRNGFETLARLGYAARGLVYVLIALIALFGSFGGGEDASSSGALSSLLGQPFGKILLGLVAIGLLGHVLWRLAQSLLNADHHESDMKGYGTRAGHFASAVAHGALALSAAQLALGGGTASGSGEKGLVAAIMGLPFGNILAMLAGLVLMGVAAAQIWYGVSGGFRKRLRIPAAQERVLVPVSTYGIMARGLVFLILGGFLVYAGFTVNPEQAGSVPEALDWVAGLPFGGVLYIVVAVGLLAFAAYNGVQALYRRVDAPSAGAVRRAMPGV